MSLNLDKTTWQRVKFGDVAAASKEKVDPDSGEVGRYVAGEHMGTDELKIHRWGEVGDGYLGPAFHRRFRPGQVLYGSRRTYLRKVAVADFGGVTANTTFIVESKDVSILLQQFLPFIMTSEPFHAFSIAESKGSVNPYVNWSDLAKYEFDLPPLDEQKRLADLLWAVERHAGSTGRSRTSVTDSVRVAVDVRLQQLPDGSLVPFREVWSGTPESGWSASPVSTDTGRYVLSLSALGPHGYERGMLKNVPESPEVRQTTLSYGDLLISRANTAETVGRVGIFDEERADVSFPDTMMRLHLADAVLPEFATLVLASGDGRRHMRRHAAGSATSMVKINRKSLGSFEFPLVAVETQRELLDEVDQYTRAVDALNREESAIGALRRSLLANIYGGN